MAKGYWIVAYRSVSEPEKVSAYGKLATGAIAAAGGKFLARGGRLTAHEAGVDQRTVIVEFPSYEQAVAAYETPAYQEALDVLGDSVERDVRVIEGVD